MHQPIGQIKVQSSAESIKRLSANAYTSEETEQTPPQSSSCGGNVNGADLDCKGGTVFARLLIRQDGKLAGSNRRFSAGLVCQLQLVCGVVSACLAEFHQEIVGQLRPGPHGIRPGLLLLDEELRLCNQCATSSDAPQSLEPTAP